MAFLSSAILLLGCRTPSLATEAGATGPTDEFPRPGNYDVVQEGSYGRKQTIEPLDVSNSRSFQEFIMRDARHCRDVASSFRDGRFSVRMTCDTPDGDIRDIKEEIYGTYSATSLQITRKTRIFGVETKQIITYTLKQQ